MKREVINQGRPNQLGHKFDSPFVEMKLVTTGFKVFFLFSQNFLNLPTFLIRAIQFFRELFQNHQFLYTLYFAPAAGEVAEF
ncbi:MAG: hypothetical protein Ct9H300mP28_35630 [Pseudomonadota bacterium]|nr:MAG: hypothetical protein Ct9H300mP28_35630 [Pseudomonadota bacterium]